MTNDRGPFVPLSASEIDQETAKLIETIRRRDPNAFQSFRTAAETGSSIDEDVEELTLVQLPTSRPGLSSPGWVKRSLGIAASLILVVALAVSAVALFEQFSRPTTVTVAAFVDQTDAQCHALATETPSINSLLAKAALLETTPSSLRTAGSQLQRLATTRTPTGGQQETAIAALEPLQEAATLFAQLADQVAARNVVAAATSVRHIQVDVAAGYGMLSKLGVKQCQLVP